MGRQPRFRLTDPGGREFAGLGGRGVGFDPGVVKAPVALFLRLPGSEQGVDFRRPRG